MKFSKLIIQIKRQIKMKDRVVNGLRMKFMIDGQVCRGSNREERDVQPESQRAN